MTTKRETATNSDQTTSLHNMKNVNFVFCELCHEEGRKRTQPIKWAFLDDGAYKFFRCEQHGIDPEFDDSEGWHEWE